MIEIIRRLSSHPRLVVFDFDGTLSLIRTGWQRVMCRMMIEALHTAAAHEETAALERHALQFIARSTGQPTIEQMDWLVAEVARRNAMPASAAAYKQQFSAQLSVLIEQRLDDARQGRLAPDALLVPGARALLGALRERQVMLAMVSGSDQVDLIREAGALQIADVFDAGIYGPGPHDPTFSKQAAIERLLSASGLNGAELVGFGDGPAETMAVRAVGGLAVGVALDEAHGNRLDAARRAALLAVGADAIVPHFGDQTALLALLFDRDSTTS
jgi:phosphoglycolate phosphatase